MMSISERMKRYKINTDFKLNICNIYCKKLLTEVSFLKEGGRNVFEVSI